MRPTFAEINLNNLKNNFLNIRKKVRNAKIMAVVKADAYGHGVKEVVDLYNSLGNKRPEYFAVAICDEALELRKNNVKQPVLVFDPFEKSEAETVFKYNIMPTVFNNSHLDILLKAGNKLATKNSAGKKIKVHVKIDTGMNRLGINSDEAVPFIEKLSKNEKFLIDGIYTHFATSDDKDKTFANIQLKRFKDLLDELKKRNINYGLAHAANSGAILDMPDSYFDMIRPGICLYGYYPSLETSESIELKPVMSLISRVASVKTISKNDTVGYGQTFTAKTRTKIVSVPIGYADGYNRNLSNKAKAVINGKQYNLIGRVAMDRIMFNVKSDDVKVNDKVILIGKENGVQVTAWDWSKLLDTIPYEVTCNISKRVPRVYKK
ncbi:MAG: alanine racemase [Ignavibacteriaceae bacterium]|nr:alanine racemase [Ignavibacteriaceae bacterium]